jgi:hypothetical protein
MMTSDFQNFKKNVSLLKSFYTVDRYVREVTYEGENPLESLIGSEGPNDTLKNNIKKKINRHSEISYLYSNLMEASCYSTFSCCCRDGPY